MAVVTFDASGFKGRYPEFALASNATLSACFDESGLYLSNTDASPVQDVTRRKLLLWMLTAHIATIGGILSADGKPLPVGRMSQASEGSVSASFEGVPPTPGTGAWFQQTQYGASFWQVTSSIRGFRYFANATRY